MANDNKGINPAAAGVVGAVIGAAAAGAAIALSDKGNRKKIEKVYKELKTEGNKRFTQLKKAADQVRDQAVSQLEKGKTKVKDETVSSKVAKSNLKKS